MKPQFILVGDHTNFGKQAINVALVKAMWVARWTESERDSWCIEFSFGPGDTYLAMYESESAARDAFGRLSRGGDVE